MLVFKLDKPLAYNTKVMQMFNINEMKQQSPIESAIRIGKTIDRNTVFKIAEIISQFESVKECLANTKAFKNILEILRGNKIIHQNEISAYITPNNLSFTESGNEFFETIL